MNQFQSFFLKKNEKITKTYIRVLISFITLKQGTIKLFIMDNCLERKSFKRILDEVSLS